MEDRSQSRASCWSCLAIFVLIVLQAVAIGCQHNDASRVRIQLHDLPNDKKAVSTKPVPPPPVCPSAGVTPLQPGAPGTGHHKVTLTWNASAPRTSSGSAVAGYCLYRSLIQYRQELKQDPRCKHCEQINKVPVATTGCVDDFVVDEAKYYYVVTAIDANSNWSVPSNDVFVPIPSARSVKPSQPTALPLCRAGLAPQAH
jgi:hypothetical protein